MHKQLLAVTVVLVILSKISGAAKTESFDVTTYITNRFAETTITSKVTNDGANDQLIEFQSLLPKEAFISAFSLTIDGKTYDAIVEEKEKAKKTFEAAQKLNKTAGLVQTRQTSTKTFKTSVNVAANETVEFKLVYHQLLRRIRGKYKHQLILLGSQMTNLLTINTYICESQPIINVTVPPILNSVGERITPSFSITKNQNYAHVAFLKGENEKLLQDMSSNGGSFEVEYKLQPTGGNGTIILQGGHLAYFYAPDVEIKPRKVVFVLDVSGSMYGTKIAQLKDAMVNIIDKLTEQDSFAIVTFQSYISEWSRKFALKAATRSNIVSAQSFIRQMRASGGTDINNALIRALSIINLSEPEHTVGDPNNYIIFVTDGQPTAGVTNTYAINNNVLSANPHKHAIHAIGIGTGVDSNFLKALSAQNQGTWTQILADLNAGLQIQSYLDELSVSLLRGIVIDYPKDLFSDFFMEPEEKFLAGGEIIAYGKFKDDIDPKNRGPHNFTVSGKTDRPIKLSLRFFLDEKPQTCEALEGKVIKDFGTKAFGLAKVVEVLRQYDAETNDLMKEELKQQAIQMSLFYKLVTPVTSMLVIKPEDQKEIDEEMEKTTTTASTTTRPTTTPWTAPTRAPWTGWSVVGDPHFVIDLTNTISICFNLLGKGGEMFNLLNDKANAIVINGVLDSPDKNSENEHAIFITKLVVLLKREQLIITINPKEALVKDVANGRKRGRGVRLPMVNMEQYETAYGRVTFKIKDSNLAHSILEVTVAGNFTFIVNLHHPSAYNHTQFDHLDLILDQVGQLSPHVGGVFGHIPRPKSNSTEKTASIEKSGTNTLLWVNNDVTTVSRKKMSVPHLERKVDCWFVAKPAVVLGAPFEAFKVKSMFAEPKLSLKNH